MNRMLITVGLMAFPIHAGSAVLDKSFSPVEVRRLAFQSLDQCTDQVTGTSSFKKGECGTSGCMNILLSCKINGEMVVKGKAQAAIDFARGRGIDENCINALNSLGEIATGDLGESEYDGAAEGSFDAQQSIGLVRRLAAYELIYITINDPSCFGGIRKK